MMTMIEARAKGKPTKAKALPKAKPATEVVNLMDVLQQSLKSSKSRVAAGNGKAEANGKPAAKKRRVAAAAK
jgi:non-homologous end joining protein Ku